MKKEIDWEPFRNQEDALSSLGRRNKEWCVLSHPMEIQNRFPHSYPFPLPHFLFPFQDPPDFKNSANAP